MQLHTIFRIGSNNINTKPVAWRTYSVSWAALYVFDETRAPNVVFGALVL